LIFPAQPDVAGENALVLATEGVDAFSGFGRGKSLNSPLLRV
jgi:hypothetical protein